MTLHTYQDSFDSRSSSLGLSFGLAALLILAAGYLPAATRLPRFPPMPDTIGQPRWTALQNAVAQAIPSSTELTANDGAADVNFGASVAVSGITALVGADGYNNDQGAVYVFTFNGSTWVQQQELVASDGAAFDIFGVSVALSGTTALVGAYLKQIGSNTSQGAAYVFTFNGSTWVQQQELTASDGAADSEFGISVALTGTTALVGSFGKEVGSNPSQGAAYVFTFNGSTWVQQQELVASDGAADDDFGSPVALSGTTALVGAPYHTVGLNSTQGAAYVFKLNGSTWIQQQELTGSDGAANDYFGWSVALSGTTASVGAENKTIGSNVAQGAVYVFTSNGSTWVQQQELTASDGEANDFFGKSVALSGTTALVGAPDDPFDSTDGLGAVYVFTSSGNTWTQYQELTPSDGVANDDFGYSVALSGNTALVGARRETIGSNSYQGAAYVFNPVGDDTIFCDGFDGTGVCK